MDAFDFADAQQTQRRNRSGLIWNILTLLVVAAVLCVAAAFAALFLNPQAGFNPFPPPTEIPLLVLPTSSPTAPSLLDPTWTPSPSPEPSPTVLRPTRTPLISDTPEPLPSPDGTANPGGFSFVVQQGSPQAISNIYDSTAGCDWMGVGGQALDLTGAPVVSLIVELGGTLEGRTFDGVLGLTGTAQQLGPGGFVFQLGDRPVASQGALFVQLLDQQGLPLSDKIYFDTFGECEQNLIVIQFKQVR